MTMAIDTLVIDASAAISVVRAEEARNAVLQVIDSPATRRLVVPEVFWVEVTNTLVRRYGQPMDGVLDAIALLDGLGLRTVHASRAGLLSTAAVMIEHGLSAYDATYLALAESLGASLLTLDRHLVSAAGSRAVNLDPDDLREPRAAYRLEPWIDWDDAAKYLKAVRRVTLDEARV